MPPQGALRPDRHRPHARPRGGPRKVLLVDNYDSFTFNLEQLVGGLGVPVVVHLATTPSICPPSRRSPPATSSCRPARAPANRRDFGICAALIHRVVAAGGPPLLGVCLGHQGIAHHLGGTVHQAPAIVHGKTSAVRHRGAGLFAGLPDGFLAMRYHSFVVDRATLPPTLQVTAWTDDGLVMGLAHQTRPLWGVQFHPESFATEGGARILSNFLESSAR
ncbi:MAG: gamma-glutamyl-gamma-aminobutyrate hydrolase family protein [bacterium]